MPVGYGPVAQSVQDFYREMRTPGRPARDRSKNKAARKARRANR